MTDLSDLCPHCVIGDLIEANIPQGSYRDVELVRALIELALDMINSAPPEDREKLDKQAIAQLLSGLEDIRDHTYKTNSESGTRH